MSTRLSKADIQRIQCHGVPAICAGCGARFRHHPGVDPRLRDRNCHNCGCKARYEWWALKNPKEWRAFQLKERELNGLLRQVS